MANDRSRVTSDYLDYSFAFKGLSCVRRGISFSGLNLRTRSLHHDVFLDLGDTDESNGHNSVGQSHRKTDLDKEHKGRPQKRSPSMKRGSIPSQ